MCESGTEVCVNVRVEGLTKTVFEGSVRTIGRKISTESGGEHCCNVRKNGQNPGTDPAGPNCTAALDVASQSQVLFTYDGTFNSDYNDYFINRIGEDWNTSTEFWLLYLDLMEAQVGGCQLAVTEGQEVLWAFGPYGRRRLKTTGPSLARVHQPVTYHVVDQDGNPVEGATVWPGSTTDARGMVTIIFPEPGLKTLKAEKPNYIRSNRVDTVVLGVHSETDP